MADFVQVMKYWRRMCDWLTGEYGDDSCLHCPVYECSEEYNGCDAIFTKWAETMDWAKFEEIIAKWVAEHPEPVYPTWYDWLAGHGLDPDDPIPADIAQKLGIEAKEG